MYVFLLLDDWENYNIAPVVFVFPLFYVSNALHSNSLFSRISFIFLFLFFIFSMALPTPWRNCPPDARRVKIIKSSKKRILKKKRFIYSTMCVYIYINICTAVCNHATHMKSPESNLFRDGQHSRNVMDPHWQSWRRSPTDTRVPKIQFSNTNGGEGQTEQKRRKPTRL